MSKLDDGEAREFHVETKFQQYAKRPGGIPREQAVVNAQTTVAALKQLEEPRAVAARSGLDYDAVVPAIIIRNEAKAAAAKKVGA